MDTSSPSEQPLKKNSLDIKLDLRLICILLLGIIIAMLLIWKPWADNTNAKDRVIEVTGETKFEATPDQFTFNPSYQFETATKELALEQVAVKSTEVVDGLKKLGVAEKDIKTNSNGYEQTTFPRENPGQLIYNLQLTVVVKDSKLVQTVQDYLVATAPTGTISPYATFSDTTRTKLEDRGRTEAIADARRKAGQSAEELGFTIDKVKTIKDTSNDVGIMRPLMNEAYAASDQIGAPSIGVQPGQNDFTYRVTVNYYIK